ncbi:hypothetical protein ACHAQH_004953 [Verticillium albo-atrum]
MARATSATDKHHNQTIFIIVSTTCLVLMLACGVMLLICARKRHCERRDFDVERQDWRKSYLTHCGTIKSLERQLSCCTCHSAMPWDENGGTRPKRDTVVVVNIPENEMAAPAQDTDHFSPVLERWFPEQEGGMQMIFWEEAQSEGAPARSPVQERAAPGNVDMFVVGDDSEEESNAGQTKQ